MNVCMYSCNKCLFMGLHADGFLYKSIQQSFVGLNLYFIAMYVDPANITSTRASMAFMSVWASLMALVRFDKKPID